MVEDDKIFKYLYIIMILVYGIPNMIKSEWINGLKGKWRNDSPTYSPYIGTYVGSI